MSVQHRHQLSRLHIPPSLAHQQPTTMDGVMFSPALPTALHHTFHPPFPMNMPPSMQTPLQASFFAPPGAPMRPHHVGHRPIASVSQMGGVLPSPLPMGMGPGHMRPPMGFPPPSMGAPPMGPPPFVPKSRRTTSIGGPPKALLGGPGRKLSPLPPISQSVAAITKKRLAVKIPVESDFQRPDSFAEGASRSIWSRAPIPVDKGSERVIIEPPALVSAEAHPEDSSRLPLPPTIDIFLPSKAAWDEMKQREIEEKLQKLGVEKRADHLPVPGFPDVLAPHARSASISSPADPALLFYKLNKLQQAQTATSLSTSPQPQGTISPNPQVPPRFQNKHTHSMSFVQPMPFVAQASSNVPDVLMFPAEHGGEGQDSSPGIVPASLGQPQALPPQLAVPYVPSRPESKPDFIRGFGLDIPEEDEEGHEEDDDAPVGGASGGTDKARHEEILDHSDGEIRSTTEDDVASSAEQRVSDTVAPVVASIVMPHTRHASRISVALSVGSMSKAAEPVAPSGAEDRAAESAAVNVDPDRAFYLKEEAVNEWVDNQNIGSDDDDESIGEWSNPSDEERARQARVERRMHRQTQQDLQATRTYSQPRNEYLAPEDDVISNPSEEEAVHRRYGPTVFVDTSRPASGSSGRPLPPLPHSRAPSGHHMMPEPLPFAQDGIMPVYPPEPEPFIHTGRRESLNPLAKPFVFGGGPQPPASAVGFASPHSSVAHMPSATHSRLPSLGSSRALNAAAQEFKPLGFSFRLPTGAPEFTLDAQPVPSTPPSRPLPELPAPAVHAVQGREKRQRRSMDFSSEQEAEDLENAEALQSFRFPPTPSSTGKLHRSAPSSPTQDVLQPKPLLSASTNPPTYAAFLGKTMEFPMPIVPPMPLDSNDVDGSESMSQDEGSDIMEDSRSPSPSLPHIGKQRRAPIPLDFTHPISTNMVPAGLFKNRTNTESEEKVRSAARSRLHSREASEVNSDISLDDRSVPTIARKISLGNMLQETLRPKPSFTEGIGLPSLDTKMERPVASPSPRSSYDSDDDLYISPAPAAPQDDMDMDRLEAMLDSKIEDLRTAILTQNGLASTKVISQATEDMVREAMDMFRAQLRGSVDRELDDSRADARGELDFELIRNVIDQGHADARQLIDQRLSEIIRLLSMRNAQEANHELIDSVQMLQEHLMGYHNDVVGRLANMEMANIDNARQDRDSLVYDLIHALTPNLAALRQEPLDYDNLTMQLSQAVKPHISQLIDLASDKRETAGLIVDALAPLLKAFAPSSPSFSTEELVSELTANFSKIVGPIDAHIIKEEVSDLVVERLDARLAVRDSAMNADKLVQGMASELVPLSERIEGLKHSIEDLAAQQADMSDLVSELPTTNEGVGLLFKQLGSQLEAIHNTLESVRSTTEGTVQHNEHVRHFSSIEEALQRSSVSNDTVSAQTAEVRKLVEALSDRTGNIPESLGALSNRLKAQHEELLSAVARKEDSEELRRLATTNTDLQVQLAKARGAHGQVRVEKDNLQDRLVSAESEQETLRQQIADLQLALSKKVEECANLVSRAAKHEDAMHEALDRVKNADVTTRSQQERIASLEKANRELSQEKQQQQCKVTSLESQVQSANKEKALVAESLALLQSDHERLVGQMGNFDDLRRAADQVDNLSKLIGQVNTADLDELKRTRDRSTVLEKEHAALQKRFKEQETKIANIERASLTARQNLASAQQRSSEWEKKARDAEGELERISTQLEQSEQIRTQLDADYSLVKLQLDEREADDRLSKDREKKLVIEVSKLKTELAQRTAELEQQVSLMTRTDSGYWEHSPASRPVSRTSAAYGASVPQTPKMNGNRALSRPQGARNPSPITPSPPTSTMDSIHAPRRQSSYAVPTTPKARHSVMYPHVPRAPSPTPSTVSLTPTQGDDGWWT